MEDVSFIMTIFQKNISTAFIAQYVTSEITVLNPNSHKGNNSDMAAALRIVLDFKS